MLTPSQLLKGHWPSLQQEQVSSRTCDARSTWTINTWKHSTCGYDACYSSGRKEDSLVETASCDTGTWKQLWVTCTWQPQKKLQTDAPKDDHYRWNFSHQAHNLTILKEINTSEYHSFLVSRQCRVNWSSVCRWEGSSGIFCFLMSSYANWSGWGRTQNTEFPWEVLTEFWIGASYFIAMRWD